MVGHRLHLRGESRPRLLLIGKGGFGYLESGLRSRDGSMVHLVVQRQAGRIRNWRARANRSFAQDASKDCGKRK